MEQQGNTDYSSLEFSGIENYSGARIETIEALGMNYLSLETTKDWVVDTEEIRATLSNFPLAEIFPFITPLYARSITDNNSYESSKKILIYAIRSWQKGSSSELIVLDRQTNLVGKTATEIAEMGLKHGASQTPTEIKLNEITDFLVSPYKPENDLKIADSINKLGSGFNVLSTDYRKRDKFVQCFDCVNNWGFFKNILVFSEKLSEKQLADWHAGMALLWLILPATYSLPHTYDQKTINMFKKNLGVDNLVIDEAKYLIGMTMLSYKLFLKSVYDNQVVFSNTTFIELLEESSVNKNLQISVENQRNQINDDIDQLTRLLFLNPKESLRCKGEDINQIHKALTADFVKNLGLFLKMVTGLELSEYLAEPKINETEEKPTSTLDKIIDRLPFSYSTIESVDLSELKQIKLFLESISLSQPVEWGDTLVEDLLQLICQNNPDLGLEEAIVDSERITKAQADKLLKSINLAFENKTTQTLTQESPQFKQAVLQVQDLWLQSCLNLSQEQQRELSLQIASYCQLDQKILKFNSTGSIAHTQSFFNLLNQTFPGFAALDKNQVSIPNSLVKNLLLKSLSVFSSEIKETKTESRPRSISQMQDFLATNNIQTNLDSDTKWINLLSNSGGDNSYILRKVYSILKDILNCGGIDNFRSGVSKREFAYGKTEKLREVSSISGFKIPEERVCLRINLSHRIVVGEENVNGQKLYVVYVGNYHNYI